MQVSVQLTAKLASEVAGGRKQAVKGLNSVMSAFGVALKPLHPDAADPELQKQFFINVSDEETGQQVCQSLLAINGVEAAYLKSGDESPFNS